MLYLWSYFRNFVSAAKIEIRGILKRIWEGYGLTTEFFLKRAEKDAFFTNRLWQ